MSTVSVTNANPDGLLERVTALVDEVLGPLPDVLIPSELAQLFRVDPKTVSRWTIPGTFRTLGGHKRYYKEPVRAELIRRRMEDEVRVRVKSDRGVKSK